MQDVPTHDFKLQQDIDENNYQSQYKPVISPRESLQIKTQNQNFDLSSVYRDLQNITNSLNREDQDRKRKALQANQQILETQQEVIKQSLLQSIKSSQETLSPRSVQYDNLKKFTQQKIQLEIDQKKAELENSLSSCQLRIQNFESQNRGELMKGYQEFQETQKGLSQLNFLSKYSDIQGSSNDQLKSQSHTNMTDNDTINATDSTFIHQRRYNDCDSPNIASQTSQNDLQNNLNFQVANSLTDSQTFKVNQSKSNYNNHNFMRVQNEDKIQGTQRHKFSIQNIREEEIGSHQIIVSSPNLEALYDQSIHQNDNFNSNNLLSYNSQGSLNIQSQQYLSVGQDQEDCDSRVNYDSCQVVSASFQAVKFQEYEGMKHLMQSQDTLDKTSHINHMNDSSFIESEQQCAVKPEQPLDLQREFEEHLLQNPMSRDQNVKNQRNGFTFNTKYSNVLNFDENQENLLIQIQKDTPDFQEDQVEQHQYLSQAQPFSEQRNFGNIQQNQPKNYVQNFKNNQKQIIEQHLKQLMVQLENQDPEENSQENEAIEEMILEFYRISKQNNGVIPQNLSQKLNSVQKDLQLKNAKNTFMKNLQNNSTALNGNSTLASMRTNYSSFESTQGGFKSLNGLESSQQTNFNYSILPDFINKTGFKNDQNIQRIYHEHHFNYDKALQNLNIRKISQFNSLKSPTQTEINLGLLYLLIFSSLDSSIRLKNDKSTLLDKSWNNSVQKYFNNCGKVIQNLRKIRDAIDYDRISAVILREIQQIWDCGVNYHELKSEASRDLRDFINVVIERILLNKQTKELMGEKNDSQAHKQFQGVQTFKKDDKPPMEVAPHYDEFKHQINSTLFNQNMEFENEMKQKQDEVIRTEKMVKDLKAKEKQLKWTIQRKDKREEVQRKKEQDQEYMQYQQYLKQQFQLFLKDRIMLDKKERSVKSKEHVLETRLHKMKENAIYRLQLIDEFKETLDKLEWGQRLKESQVHEKKQKHEDFINKMKEDKMFKQEVYAIERIIEFEERKTQRQKDMEFKHSQLLKEQQEVMKNIEYMLKANRQ
eukprot:403343355